MSQTYLVADIGNTTIDIGAFRTPNASHSGEDVSLPQPLSTCKVDSVTEDYHEVESWLRSSVGGNQTANHWVIGSVNKPARRRLADWLKTREAKIHDVTPNHVPIDSSVRYREQVGVDRLAACFAANRLRHPLRSAIVICSGSAITVNVVSASGVFLGGMIMPGMDLSFRSLLQETDQLPHVQPGDQIPPLVGDDTISAIQSGVYWKTVGGINDAIRRVETEVSGHCDVFGCGGSMRWLLPELDERIRHEPNLVLSGLALVPR